MVNDMKITLNKAEKEKLNDQFKDRGSTPELIDEWLSYESRLLKKEIEVVFSDFLDKRKIFEDIGKEKVQKELEDLESTST